MEPVYGIHLGLVVSDGPDPEGRNRIQVWVPHLSNTLFKSINNKLTDSGFNGGKDLNIKDPSDLNVIDPNIVKTLRMTLPWAEYGAPLFGGSSGNYNHAVGGTSTTSTSPFPSIPPLYPPSQVPTSENMTLSGTKPSINGSNNSSLAQARQQYFEGQLTPDVLNRIAFLATQEEVGSNPVAQQAFIETLFNRAQFGNKSLSDIVNQSAYGFGSGSIEAPTSTLNAVATVMNGGNVTGMATDNAFNDKTLFATRNFINNGTTGIWMDLKTGQTITDPNQIQDLVSNPGNGSIEYFYQKSGTGDGSSPAGRNAAAFAQANGVETTNADPSLIGPSNDIAASGQRPVSYLSRNAGGMKEANIGTAGSAVGTFTTPNAGAKVWVFFIGGDVQRPVYFAQAVNTGDVKAFTG